MERHDAAHQDGVHGDVAAYALGVLDPADAAHYERHLAGCASCAQELAQLLPTSTLLSGIDPASLREPEETGILDRLVAAVAAERRRIRQRHRFAVVAGVAATVFAAGFALFAGSSWLPADSGAQVASPPPVQATTPPAGIGGSVDPEGDRHTATDPATGVTVEAQLTSWDWGTEVSFTLSTLAGPRDCELILVYADGSEKIAGSWHVPPEGYGTATNPAPLTLDAPVGGELANLVELKVVELLPGGTNRPLVTLPL